MIIEIDRKSVLIFGPNPRIILIVRIFLLIVQITCYKTEIYYLTFHLSQNTYVLQTYD